MLAMPMTRRLRQTLTALAACSLGGAMAQPARADEPFVDRALTLAPLHFSADAALGFGQGPGTIPSDVTGGTATLPETGVKLGWGANLEAAVGLPFLGEVGVRVGVRFG